MKKLMFVIALCAIIAGFNQNVFAGGGPSEQVVDNYVDICSETPWLSICGNMDQTTFVESLDGFDKFTVGVITGCDNEKYYDLIDMNGETYMFQEGTVEILEFTEGVSPRIFWGDDGIKLILPADYGLFDEGKAPVCSPIGTYGFDFWHQYFWYQK